MCSEGRQSGLCLQDLIRFVYLHHRLRPAPDCRRNRALLYARPPPCGDAGCPVPHNAPSPLAADARASRHWTVASRGASIPDAFALVLWRSAGDSLTMPLTIMVAGFQAHCEVRSEFPAVPPSFRVCLHRLPSSLITLLDLAERFCHICCT